MSANIKTNSRIRSVPSRSAIRSAAARATNLLRTAPAQSPEWFVAAGFSNVTCKAIREIIRNRQARLMSPRRPDEYVTPNYVPSVKPDWYRKAMKRATKYPKTYRLSDRARNLVTAWNELSANVDETIIDDRGNEKPAPLPVTFGQLNQMAGRSILMQRAAEHLLDECLTESHFYPRATRPASAYAEYERTMCEKPKSLLRVTINAMEVEDNTEIKAAYGSDRFVQRTLESTGIPKSIRSLEAKLAKARSSDRNLGKAIAGYEARIAALQARLNDLTKQMTAFSKRVRKLPDTQKRLVRWVSPEGSGHRVGLLSALDKQAAREGDAVTRLHKQTTFGRFVIESMVDSIERQEFVFRTPDQTTYHFGTGMFRPAWEQRMFDACAKHAQNGKMEFLGAVSTKRRGCGERLLGSQRMLNGMYLPGFRSNDGYTWIPKPTAEDLKRRYRGKWKNYQPGKYQYRKSAAIRSQFAALDRDNAFKRLHAVGLTSRQILAVLRHRETVTITEPVQQKYKRGGKRFVRTVQVKREVKRQAWSIQSILRADDKTIRKIGKQFRRHKGVARGVNRTYIYTRQDVAKRVAKREAKQKARIRLVMSDMGYSAPQITKLIGKHGIIPLLKLLGCPLR